MNGELWGKPTDLPWGVVFGGSAGEIPRHPSQLYEAFLEGIVLFVILYSMSRKKKLPPQGAFIGTFVLGYGVVRFLIEFVRVPDAQLGYLFGGFITMGQLLSLPLILIGAALLFYAYKASRPQHSVRFWTRTSGQRGKRASGKAYEEKDVLQRPRTRGGVFGFDCRAAGAVAPGCRGDF